MMPRAGSAATNARLKIAFHSAYPRGALATGPAARHGAQRAQSLLLLSEPTGFGSHTCRPGPVRHHPGWVKCQDSGLSV